MNPVFQISITDKCNADCFFCISKQTFQIEHSQIDWRTFNNACVWAREQGCTIAKITGKGEPLLKLKDVVKSAEIMKKYFNTVELQTNGKLLKSTWKGLQDKVDLIAISCVHYELSPNQKIYGSDYINLAEMLQLLYFKFKLRLTCTLIKKLIDSEFQIKKFVEYFKYFKGLQFSFIYIGGNEDIIKDHKVPQIFDKKWVRIGYQTIYCNQCLPKENDNVRHLIYFPDGKVRTNWDKENSIVWS